MLRAVPMLGALMLLGASTAFAASTPPPSETAPRGNAGRAPSLSTQLAQSNGIIHPPPGAYAGSVIKPKATGTMPVITPREKHGPNVVPK